MKIKYKNTEFTVKPNTLGIGKVISELSSNYEDEMLIRQYHVIKLPDFEKYQMIINAISSLAGDRETQAGKLESLKNKKSQEAKELERIIKADDKALEAEYKKLRVPALSFIGNRMMNIRREVNFGFTNDTAIFKTLCDTLLEGDKSVIDFDKSDKELLELRDVVYRTFFTIKQQIYELQPIQ